MHPELAPVAVLLEEVQQLDAWAQDLRREAGALLLRQGAGDPLAARRLASALGVDARLVQLLVRMAFATRVARRGPPARESVVGRGSEG